MYAFVHKLTYLCRGSRYISIHILKHIYTYYLHIYIHTYIQIVSQLELDLLLHRQIDGVTAMP
jgi:hypothetical protein